MVAVSARSRSLIIMDIEFHDFRLAIKNLFVLFAFFFLKKLYLFDHFRTSKLYKSKLTYLIDLTMIMF